MVVYSYTYLYSSILLSPSIVTPMSLSENKKRKTGMPTLLLLLLNPLTSLPIRKSLSLLPEKNIFPTKSRHLPTINLKTSIILILFSITYDEWCTISSPNKMTVDCFLPSITHITEIRSKEWVVDHQLMHERYWKLVIMLLCTSLLYQLKHRIPALYNRAAGSIPFLIARCTRLLATLMYYINILFSKYTIAGIESLLWTNQCFVFLFFSSSTQIR